MSEQLGVLERAASIATESLKKIEAPKVEKAQAEAKVAAEEKIKAEASEKDKGITLAKEAEAKSKEDARILAEDDTKLAEADKKRKAELVKAKEAEDATPDAKIKRVQEATQKRIDEIKSEQLAKENKTAAELAALKAELEELKKPKQVEDIKAKIKREQTEQIAKFVEEDKSKPKEERREMAKESLDEWYLEDPVEATKWIQRNEYRRMRDLEKAEEAASKPVDNTTEKQRLAKEFADEQNKSRAKLIEKFPKLVPSVETINRIRTTLGQPLNTKLDQAQLKAFNVEYAKECEEFKLVQELVAENPKEYLEKTNGPELIAEEVSKRLSAKSGKPKTFTEDELEAEIKRRKLVDGEGITSTNGGKRNVEDKNKNKSELRQKQEAIARKAKISIEDLDKTLERRRGIPGTGSYDKDEKD